MYFGCRDFIRNRLFWGSFLYSFRIADHPRTWKDACLIVGFLGLSAGGAGMYSVHSCQSLPDQAYPFWWIIGRTIEVRILERLVRLA